MGHGQHHSDQIVRDQRGIELLASHFRALHGQGLQAQGLFTGSGVVEAGCRTVVGERLKQSGTFWVLAGAHNILDIRCVIEDAQSDQFWKERSLAPTSLARAA